MSANRKDIGPTHRKTLPYQRGASGMGEPEFDRLADRYNELHKENISISGEGPEYFANYKIRDFRAYVERLGLPLSGDFLDFGSGIGASIRPFQKYLPNATLTCADISAASLSQSRAQYGDAVRYELLDEHAGPRAAQRFDGAFANCVFHHIPPEGHSEVLSSLWHQLKPAGLLMVYEHNPINPLTVRAVRTCALDKNAILIRAWRWPALLKHHGFADVRIDYRVFFPAVLAPLRPMEAWLRWLPLGAQYCVTCRRL